MPVAGEGMPMLREEASMPSMGTAPVPVGASAGRADE